LGSGRNEYRQRSACGAARNEGPEGEDVKESERKECIGIIKQI
jgi:hypothetical protein